MKLRSTLTVLSLVVIPVVAFAGGCGSSSTGNGGPGGGSGQSSGGGNNDGSASSSGSGDAGAFDTGGGGSPDQQCAMMSSASNCVACCAQNHTQAYLDFINATVSCECSADGGMGVCQGPCATEFCAMQNATPGDQCDQCLVGSLDPEAGAMCLQALSQACPPGGACDPYLSCANACQ